MPTNWSRRYKNHSEKLRSGRHLPGGRGGAEPVDPGQGQGPVGRREAHAAAGPPDPRLGAHLRPERRRGDGRGPARRGASLSRRRAPGAAVVARGRARRASCPGRSVRSVGGRRFGPVRGPSLGPRRPPAAWSWWPAGRWPTTWCRPAGDGGRRPVTGLWPAPTRWCRAAPTRAASVRAGLAAVPGDAAVVVVHDAARPFAAPALFAAVVGAVAAGRAPTAPSRVLPVADTVKRVSGDSVVATVDRDGLVAVQTPQAFVAAAPAPGPRRRRRGHRRRGPARGHRRYGAHRAREPEEPEDHPARGPGRGRGAPGGDDDGGGAGGRDAALRVGQGLDVHRVRRRRRPPPGPGWGDRHRRGRPGPRRPQRRRRRGPRRGRRRARGGRTGGPGPPLPRHRSVVGGGRQPGDPGRRRGPGRRGRAGHRSTPTARWWPSAPAGPPRRHDGRAAAARPWGPRST